jgi:3-deoxy-manno-octulosonate cytidylyltransferase (CMP-KDO synthetase)
MLVVIPARYASTRLPAKPLLDIAGQPMIRHVHDRAVEAGASRVIVATDDERIAEAVRAFDGEVCMTAAHHRSGTDRLAEVVSRLGIGGDEIVVNLQGDEPLMPPELVRQVAETLAAHPDAVMATAAHPVHDRADFQNPNVVKVVLDRNHCALYFSRAPIPWPRDTAQDGAATVHALRHIGLYAYRAGFLARYTLWEPCELEKLESLEQLRVLWHGERIAVQVTSHAPPAGVDTPEDIARVREHFSVL